MTAFQRIAIFAAALGATLAAPLAHAWDYTGHRIVNQLAVAGLPEDFPDFARTPAALERIAFLAGEPDRWRNNPDLPIKHYNGLDHYIDIEMVEWAGLDLATISPLRYEFAVAFAQGRAANVDKFTPIKAEKNADRTQEWCGFLPWAITEYYGKLRSAFSYLKTFRELGTPEEIAQAEANVILLMGLMGHYVGDGAQPLHITVHHNGWVGPNPHGYSTYPRLHQFIDGDFIARADITYESLVARALPANPLRLETADSARDPVFDAVIAYLQTQHTQVEPLYQLDKARKFDASSPEASAEGRAFIEERLLRGGEMLSTLWLSAWRNTVEDTYLRRELLKRTAAAKGGAPAAVNE